MQINELNAALFKYQNTIGLHASLLYGLDDRLYCDIFSTSNIWVAILVPTPALRNWAVHPLLPLLFGYTCVARSNMLVYVLKNSKQWYDR